MTWIFIHIITPMFRAEIDKIVQTEYEAGIKDALESVEYDTAFYTKFAKESLHYDRPKDFNLCLWQAIYTSGQMNSTLK